MRDLHEIFHPGELKAQELFNKNKSWNRRSITGLNQMFKEAIDDEIAYIIEEHKFFFIATSNSSGECDCSFRGTESDASGNLLQGVFVESPKKLILPDYSGNHIYNSLGNILLNPNIGILFIDFNTAIRLRVNGTAKIIESNSRYKQIWPKSLRYIEVGVKQIYFNCSKRIKKSVIIER